MSIGDIFSGLYSVLVWIADFLSTTMDGIITLVNGFLQLPVKFAEFFNMFPGTVFESFALVVFICIGALGLRLIIHLF